ncbi:MAG: argininosuccinate synthase, partial [Patescibacteria group bacterium]
QNLEKYVCTRNENEFKGLIDQKFAYMCYGALWYDPLMADLEAFTNKVNDKVSGTVTVMLYRGRAEVVALETPNTLFDEKLATFNKSNAFNVNASAGFTEIYTMQMKLAKLNALHILVALGGDEAKQSLLPQLRALMSLTNSRLYATEHTHDFLREHGITSQIVGKVSEKRKDAPNIAQLIRERRFDLVVNVPKRKPGTKVTTDGRIIRDLTVQQGIELVTEIDVAQLTLQKLADRKRS